MEFKLSDNFQDQPYRWKMEPAPDACILRKEYQMLSKSICEQQTN